MSEREERVKRGKEGPWGWEEAKEGRGTGESGGEGYGERSLCLRIVANEGVSGGYFDPLNSLLNPFQSSRLTNWLVLFLYRYNTDVPLYCTSATSSLCASVLEYYRWWFRAYQKRGRDVIEIRPGLSGIRFITRYRRIVYPLLCF